MWGAACQALANVKLAVCCRTSSCLHRQQKAGDEPSRVFSPSCPDPLTDFDALCPRLLHMPPRSDWGAASAAVHRDEPRLRRRRGGRSTGSSRGQLTGQDSPVHHRQHVCTPGDQVRATWASLLALLSISRACWHIHTSGGAAHAGAAVCCPADHQLRQSGIGASAGLESVLSGST